MRSIARILPVLVFVGRVVLASPIAVGRSDAVVLQDDVVCTITMTDGTTRSFTKNDMAAAMAGGRPDISKADMDKCCPENQASNDGSAFRGAQGDDQKTTPDGARAGESSNDDAVQVDESTKQGGPCPDPSTPSSTDSQKADVKAGDKTNSPPSSPDPSDSQKADFKAGDKNADIKTDGKKNPPPSSTDSSDSQKADVNADDKVNPSPDSQKADIKSDDKNADIKANDKMDSSKSDSQNANINADDKMNSPPSSTDSKMNSPPSSTDSSDSQKADINADDKNADINADDKMNSSKSSPDSQDADIEADEQDKTEPSNKGDSEEDLFDELEGTNQGQGKGNKASAAGDCPCKA